jgi:hypothetical protein
MKSSTLRLSAGALLAILLASCGGGGGGTPTTPATPTPVPVANFAGNWHGTYTITKCGQSGVFADIDWCGNLSNQPLPITLALTQTGSSVSGMLTQGTATTSVTGSVNPASHLNLSGTGVFGGGINAEIVGWDTTMSGNSMSGSWNTKLTIPGYIDHAQTVNTLTSVTKTSDKGGVIIQLTRQPNRTLQDALAALRGQ